MKRAAWSAVASIFASTVLSGVCFAADIAPSNTLAWMGGWSLTPLVDRDQNSKVVGVLALKSAEESTGSNINAVWYVRDQANASQWTAKAWSGVSEWEVIKAIKEIDAISDCYDVAWATYTPKTVAAQAAIPRDYSKGFMVDDPLLAAVEQSASRDALIDALTEWGYEVANVPLEYKAEVGSDPLRTEKMLSAFASAIEDQERLPAGSPQVFASSFQTNAQAAFALSWFCYPLSFTVPGAWSAYTTGAWVQVPCSANMGGSAICCYDMQVCRTRTIVEYTVTLSCAVGVSNTWTESECWTHSGWCTNAGGGCPATPSCNLAVPQTPGNTPPPGVCPVRTTQ